MTRILMLAMMILGGCTTTTPPSPPPPAAAAKGPTRVDGPTAKTLVAGGALLLDVRTPEEFGAGHIDRARNIPVDALSGALETLPKDRPIVVYCHSGGRSSRAARLLADKGFDARDLGGMSNW